VHNEAGVPYGQLRAELAGQAGRGQAYPVFFGSAITGAGIPQLMAAIAEPLPASDGDPDGPLSGSIFKIERGGVRFRLDVDPRLTALLPSAPVRSLQEQLPGLTAGEGVLDTTFGGYEPVHGPFPTR
jgi:hypothetical protein